MSGSQAWGSFAGSCFVRLGAGGWEIHTRRCEEEERGWEYKARLCWRETKFLPQRTVAPNETVESRLLSECGKARSDVGRGGGDTMGTGWWDRGGRVE